MKNIFFWIITLVITLGSAYYQRLTGPTYPLSGNISIDGEKINYMLHRSHGGETDHDITVEVRKPSVTGFVMWKRYKTKDEWSTINFEREEKRLVASLPNQPPAGKLMYKVFLKTDDKVYPLNNANPAVIRFKGDVPAVILIPHIIFIFLAMLLSTRTGIEVFYGSQNLKKYTIWTVATLIIGGMIFGPLTQLYAFGALWTGFPFGYDLTDNKTLIALIGWLAALLAVYKLSKPKIWIVGAAVLMLIVFLIPHSVLGSELDYEKLDKETKKDVSSTLTIQSIN
ncbi:MAG: hypothetical protein KF721_12320 [Ignavibacteriaceae bacterium]|nr:hypothetical protein [Ignavibacteriaceae bacterium]